MNRLRNNFFFLIVLLCGFYFSCKEPSVPKPYGFNRIDLPRHEYKNFSPEGCPYEMRIPTYGIVSLDTIQHEVCWYYITMPQFVAKLHITYKNLRKEKADVYDVFEEHRKLVNKHIGKVSGLTDKPFRTENSLGFFIELEGNVGTPAQFFISDSLHHVITTALYFNSALKNDSLAPVIDFLKQDMWRMIQTLKWK